MVRPYNLKKLFKCRKKFCSNGEKWSPDSVKVDELNMNRETVRLVLTKSSNMKYMQRWNWKILAIRKQRTKE
jgi:hypothetical protein